MSKHLLGFALAGAIAFASTSAFAVDVRNDDDDTLDVIISTVNDANPNEPLTTVIKLAPGEIARDVCAACTLSVGAEEEEDIVTANGDQLVVITKGAIFQEN